MDIVELNRVIEELEKKKQKRLEEHKYLMERVSLLNEARELGLLEKPLGWLRKRCPMCASSLPKKRVLGKGEIYKGSWKYFYWNCPECDYEYVKGVWMGGDG